MQQYGNVTINMPVVCTVAVNCCVQWNFCLNFELTSKFLNYVYMYSIYVEVVTSYNYSLKQTISIYITGKQECRKLVTMIPYVCIVKA